MNLNDFLTDLKTLIEAILDTGQPTLALLVNVLILGLVAGYVIWRIKSELRGLKWNNLTMAERREIIQRILNEAIELAEWMHQNLSVEDAKQTRRLTLLKKTPANQKRKTALKYAEKELTALGAAYQDKDTLRLRYESVLAQRNMPANFRFEAS